MKLLVALAVALTLFFALPAGADTGSIVVTPTEHFFGEVNEAGIIETSFKIENKGVAALTILRIKTSCGCTASTIENNVIMPGKSEKLKVSYDTDRRPGSFKKSITIYSDDPEHPSVSVLIKGKVIGKPASMARLSSGVFRIKNPVAGKSYRISFSIKSMGTLPLLIKRVHLLDSKKNIVRIVQERPQKVDIGSSVKFDLRIVAPSKSFRFYIEVISDDRFQPVLMATIVGQP